MGLFDFISRLFQRPGPKVRKPGLNPPEDGKTLRELAERIGLTEQQLQEVKVQYHEFAIPKRSGGSRRIFAPNPELKNVQRRILKRLLQKLKSHPAAMGFEKNYSIVTNASAHVGADVILRMDIKDFFNSTTNVRLRDYLYGIGWGKEAADVLVKLCTHNLTLPQGAPTSPRLSNLINYEMDVRLEGWARKVGAIYTRYADDITFSFQAQYELPTIEKWGQNPKTLESIKYDYKLKGRDRINYTIRVVKNIVSNYGYKLHMKKKLNIRRRHQQQRVTGLVVNEKVALPRKTRRRLRAVQHHLENGREASLTPQQFAGWQALQEMIEKQTNQ